MKDVIEMAREAGFTEGELAFMGDNFRRFAELVRKDERALAEPVQEFVCSTRLCHYKPTAQPTQKRHVSYVCPQCHWSLEKQQAPVQDDALQDRQKTNADHAVRCATDAIKDADGPIEAVREYYGAQPAPVQEPVAWGVFEGGNIHDDFYTQGEAEHMAYLKGPHAEVRPLYTTPPAAQPAPDLQAELDATSRQVEILSDALAESRREVAALKELNT